jgi:hypothetical protein
MRKFNLSKIGVLVLTALLPTSIWLTSCQENIDDSNIYTFTGEMMTDHFVNNPNEFSSYTILLGKGKTGQEVQLHND